jgi:hypothetical protein
MVEKKGFPFFPRNVTSITKNHSETIILYEIPRGQHTCKFPREEEPIPSAGYLCLTQKVYAILHSSFFVFFCLSFFGVLYR